MIYPIENAEEMTVRVLRSRWAERARFTDPYREPESRTFQAQSIRNLVAVLRALRAAAVCTECGRAHGTLYHAWCLPVGVPGRAWP